MLRGDRGGRERSAESAEALLRAGRRGRTTKALLGLAVAVVLWLGLEVILWGAGTQSVYRRDALGGWQVQAGMSNHHMRGSQEPHDFRLSTNPDGLRTLHTPHKEPDHWRIALMGDSNVFGWGVNDDETLAARLEEKLRVLGHQDVEVINAGQPGHSTTQMRWLFENVLARYQPDLVVLIPTLHDHNRTHMSDAEALEGAGGPIAGLRVVLARHSRVYAGLLRVLSPLASEPQLMPDQEGALRVPRVSEEERSENLDRIQEALRGWGGKLAVGLLPFYADLEVPAGDKAPNRLGEDWVRTYSQDRGIVLYDVRTCCGAGEPDALVFSFDQGHLNARGLEGVSDALAPLLKR